MSTRIPTFPIATALLIGTLSFSSTVQAQDVSSYAVSQRKVIEVAPAEHAELLTEMNGFLEAIHKINEALSKKDFAEVEKLATAMGPKGGKHSPVAKAVHEKLPPEWFALAKPTHQKFLAVASEAQNGQSVEAVLGKVAATTQQCVACHATFQLKVVPQ